MAFLRLERKTTGKAAAAGTMHHPHPAPSTSSRGRHVAAAVEEKAEAPPAAPPKGPPLLLNADVIHDVEPCKDGVGCKITTTTGNNYEVVESFEAVGRMVGFLPRH